MAVSSLSSLLEKLLNQRQRNTALKKVSYDLNCKKMPSYAIRSNPIIRCFSGVIVWVWCWWGCRLPGPALPSLSEWAEIQRPPPTRNIQKGKSIGKVGSYFLCTWLNQHCTSVVLYNWGTIICLWYCLIVKIVSCFLMQYILISYTKIDSIVCFECVCMCAHLISQSLWS